jgi:Tfp pilus assembly major pilin PilA
MALKQSEKTLVGVAMIAAGIALVVGVGLPQYDAYNASNTELTTLKDEIISLESQKTTLAAQIRILEQNTDIPSDIKVKTFTADTRERAIKQMLDQAVELASGTGNVFISLSPVEVDPLTNTAEAANPEGQQGDAAAGQNQEATAPDAGANASSGDSGESKEPPPPPAPTLSTFGYELAVRGTYDTIQKFLQAMTQQKELMEVLQVTLENEANASSGSASSSNSTLASSKAPIKLTATLRLAMQQVEP